MNSGRDISNQREIPEHLYFVQMYASNENTALDQLTPKIPNPERTLKYENITVKRISLSSSIWGCLDSIGESWISDLIYNIKDRDNSVYLNVYRIPTSSLDRSKLFLPEELYLNDMVADAYITNEYWYCDTINTEEIEVYRIKGISSKSDIHVSYVDNYIIQRYLEDTNQKPQDFDIGMFNCILEKIQMGEIHLPHEEPTETYDLQEVYPVTEIMLQDGTVVSRLKDDIEKLKEILPPISERQYCYEYGLQELNI